MAIEKRGSQWYYRFNFQGREYREPTDLAATAQNRRAAEQKEAMRLLELKAGIAKPKTTTVSFAVAADEFLEWCFTTEYRKKVNTARRIKTSFATLMHFFRSTPVADITAIDIERYKTMRLNEHQVRDITLRHDLHALSVFFRKYAIKAGWATSNPVDQVQKPSPEGAVRIHVVTPEEESRYFGVAAGNLYDVARLILLQGCRPEEIMALEQKAVDLKRGEMRILGGKSRAAVRTLPLHSESAEILTRRLAQPARWVFPSPRRPGEHIAKVNGAHDRACREAQVSFVLYDLRHTWATRMLTEVKADVKTVAELMGHSTPTIVLKHYCHPTEETKRAAMRDYEKQAQPRLKRVK